jgi:hypothetical protein
VLCGQGGGNSGGAGFTMPHFFLAPGHLALRWAPPSFPSLSCDWEVAAYEVEVSRAVCVSSHMGVGGMGAHD